MRRVIDGRRSRRYGREGGRDWHTSRDPRKRPLNHHIIVVVRGRLMGVSLSDSHTSVCVVCSARHRLSEPQQRYEMMRRAEWLCALALAWPAPRRKWRNRFNECKDVSRKMYLSECIANSPTTVDACRGEQHARTRRAGRGRPDTRAPSLKPLASRRR